MNPEPIKKIIEKIINYIGAAHDDISVSSGEDGVFCFSIKTSEPKVLIGRDGLILLALNHVVRKIAEKEGLFKDGVESFVVDVNDYQKSKVEDLKQKANMMAERARFFKSSVELEPMSSYERMIIHSFLSPFEDIATESTGDGRERRVVIRYKEVTDNK